MEANAAATHGAKISPLLKLTSPSEFLSPCPKFRVLVLGSPESTKQELFSKIFGVDLEKKLVADGFETSHDIEQELDLEGQNERLAIYTSPNFGSGDEEVYRRVRDFITSRSSETTELQNRIHCIWYCVASDEQRPVSGLEARFFGDEIATVAPEIPVMMVFTKYDDFVDQVRLDWSHEATDHGMSKLAVSHILHDLAARRFKNQIGKKWDEVLQDSKRRYNKIRKIPRVCVASGADADGDDSSFGELATATLTSLREWKQWHVKLAFAAAQRNSAAISTQFCADTAAEYFTVDTGHARKADGIDMHDIMPNFLTKAVKVFNMRDNSAVLTDPNLLIKVLEATFDSDQLPLLNESLRHNSTEPGILLGLSPHERAVLLTQVLASVVMFLDKLADEEWPYRGAMGTLTARIVQLELNAISSGKGKRELLETVEASPIFASCPLRQAIADLIVKAVRQAERISSPRAISVVDDSELQDISLSFVNDKSPDDMVLPCGLTILPLN